MSSTDSPKKSLQISPENPAFRMAYPDVFHLSFLLFNFSTRDDCKTIAAFKNGQLLGLASSVWSRQSFLPPSLLNRIFFIVRIRDAEDIEDELIRKVESTYVKLKGPEISYARLKPVESLSPKGEDLESMDIEKDFQLSEWREFLTIFQNLMSSQVRACVVQNGRSKT